MLSNYTVKISIILYLNLLNYLKIFALHLRINEEKEEEKYE